MSLNSGEFEFPSSPPTLSNNCFTSVLHNRSWLKTCRLQEITTKHFVEFVNKLSACPSVPSLPIKLLNSTVLFLSAVAFTVFLCLSICLLSKVKASSKHFLCRQEQHNDSSVQSEMVRRTLDNPKAGWLCFLNLPRQEEEWELSGEKAHKHTQADRCWTVKA